MNKRDRRKKDRPGDKIERTGFLYYERDKGFWFEENYSFAEIMIVPEKNTLLSYDRLMGLANDGDPVLYSIEQTDHGTIYHFQKNTGYKRRIASS